MDIQTSRIIKTLLCMFWFTSVGMTYAQAIPSIVATGDYHSCDLVDAEWGPAVSCWGRDDKQQSLVPALSSPTQVVAGGNHTCAIDDSGVSCWGQSVSGQTDVPSLSNPIQVTAGHDHTCALDDTGVVCWGGVNPGSPYPDVDYGQSTVPASLTGNSSLKNEIIQLVAGGYHTCALFSDEAVCWGKDDWSGEYTTIPGQSSPPALSNPTQIAAGFYHTCALHDNGVDCWGGNDWDPVHRVNLTNGQSEVPPLTNPTHISAGGWHTCAIDDTGTVCWGLDQSGQASPPDTLINPTQIDPGRSHTCVKDDSATVCWGNNTYGQSTPKPPVEIIVITNPFEIDVSTDHTCALGVTGAVCWGRNNYNQSSVPSDFNTIPSMIDLGNDFSCAVVDGTIKCWGNYQSQWRIYVLPGGIENPQQISIGSAHTCVLDKTAEGNKILCKQWQVDDDDPETPPQYNKGQSDVPTLLNPIQVVTGSQHTCALDDNGVSCWGSETSGALQIPELVNPRQLISSTYSSNTCALDDTGVVCWPQHSAISTEMPELTNPVKIDINQSGACAIDDYGRIKCWGSSGHNDDIYNSIPTSNNRYLEVSIGAHGVACAIEDNVGVVCWGASNIGSWDYGQYIPPEKQVWNAGNSTSDADNDGIRDSIDVCSLTPTNERARNNGCSDGQNDSDNDGINDVIDVCPITPSGESVANTGCSSSEDADTDGVYDLKDSCTLTPQNEEPDANGCSISQVDTDGDGYYDNVDVCPTGQSYSVDSTGCTESERDTDNDGLTDDQDSCPDTPPEQAVDGEGCSDSQKDTDEDGVNNSEDLCPATVRNGLGIIIINSAGCTLFSQMGADIDGEVDQDTFGWSTSLSADGAIVAMGSPYSENQEAGNNDGHASVYGWNGTSWAQLGLNINGELYSRSGTSVSISNDGSRLAIGAPNFHLTDENTDSIGLVRLYDWNGSAWVQVGGDLHGEADGDSFGRSVSLSSSGSRIAIGAIGNDAAANNAGSVRIFELIEGVWTQLGSDLDGEGANDQSGYSISLANDGNRVAIAARYNDGVDSAWDAGHVRLYDWNGNTWVQVGSDIDGQIGNRIGDSISLSADGSRIAIGAAYYDGADGLDNNIGMTLVYHWDGNDWSQLGALLEGEAAYERSGISVSLSDDGSRLAVGAYYSYGAASRAGHVRLYDWDGSQWLLFDADLDNAFQYQQEGYSDGHPSWDEFGWSVSLNSDGSRVAVGARYAENNNGGYPGVVRVIQIDTDSDGVVDASDICDNTPQRGSADVNGCDDSQKDTDNDGVSNAIDSCPASPNDESTDENGCAVSQDEDSDGVNDGSDLCLETPDAETVDSNGCSSSQDDDSDSINNGTDQCPATPIEETADSLGCSDSQKDTDSDGINDAADLCPATLSDSSVDSNGCSDTQKDSDNDGVNDAFDFCQATPGDELADENGCADSQKDSDNDSINDAADLCPATPFGATYDSNGCSSSQDEDGDGVNDGIDQCASSPNGQTVDLTGCPDTQVDTDGDGLSDYDEVNTHGTDPALADTDRDGMSDGYEINNGFDPLNGDDCPSWMCGSSKVWMYKLQSSQN